MSTKKTTAKKATKTEPEEMLFLRTCKPGVVAHGGFVWTLNAVAKIEKIKRGATFTAEDLRKRMREPPPHPNCVGAAFRIASGRGLISFIHSPRASRPEARGHAITEWVRR